MSSNSALVLEAASSPPWRPPQELVLSRTALPPQHDADVVPAVEPHIQFEVSRRSAEFHLREFKHFAARSESRRLVAVAAQDSQNHHDVELNDDPSTDLVRLEDARDATYWGMKVARDSLIRDYSEMRLWLAQMVEQSAQVETAVWRYWPCAGTLAVSIPVAASGASVVLTTAAGAIAASTCVGLAYSLYRDAKRKILAQRLQDSQNAVDQGLWAAHNWTLDESNESALQEIQDDRFRQRNCRREAASHRERRLLSEDKLIGGH